MLKKVASKVTKETNSQGQSKSRLLSHCLLYWALLVFQQKKKCFQVSGSSLTPTRISIIWN